MKPIPDNSHATQTTQTPPTSNTPNINDVNTYIHNFSNIEWQMDEEPPQPNNSKYPQLYHLLTITGILIVANYPHDAHTLGDHYVAWAPLTSAATLTIH